MFYYNRNNTLSSRDITSDIQNCLRLRSDIHSMLDTGAFVFVPKSGTSSVHFIMQSRDYGRLFHNRQTEQMHVAPEFLYARFAWAVLQLAQNFASQKGVKVRVWSAIMSDWQDIVLGSDIDLSPRPAESNTPPSPTKRPRLAVSDARGSNLVDAPIEETSCRLPSPIPLTASHHDCSDKRKRTFDQIGLAAHLYSCGGYLLTNWQSRQTHNMPGRQLHGTPMQRGSRG